MYQIQIKLKLKKSTTDVVSNDDYFVCDYRYVFINDGYVQFPDCMRDMTVDSPYFIEIFRV